MASLIKINDQTIIDIFKRLDEELEKSQTILMKKNFLNKLLPVHCIVLLTISSFKKPPIIIDIARKLYKSKAAVGAIVMTLKKRHYLSLVQNEHDKRAKKIILTSEGKKITKKIDAMWFGHSLMILENFNDQEKINLYQMLNKIEFNIKIYNNNNKIKI